MKLKRHVTILACAGLMLGGGYAWMQAQAQDQKQSGINLDSLIIQAEKNLSESKELSTRTMTLTTQVDDLLKLAEDVRLRSGRVK